MVPFLLPFAIGIMVVLGLGLGLFVWFYQVATPAKALVRREGSAVLLRGGTFGPASAFEELNMAERDLVVALAGDSLAVTLRPKEEEEAVRAIASSIGCAAANDHDALSALLVRALEVPGGDANESKDLVRVAQRAIDAVTPGFVIVSARRLDDSAADTA